MRIKEKQEKLSCDYLFTITIAQIESKSNILAKIIWFILPIIQIRTL